MITWRTKGLRLPMWTIYRRPTDFPAKYVVRLFDMETPTNQIAVADTLEEARGALPLHLYKLGRLAGDDSTIVEVWL